MENQNIPKAVHIKIQQLLSLSLPKIKVKRLNCQSAVVKQLLKHTKSKNRKDNNSHKIKSCSLCTSSDSGLLTSISKQHLIKLLDLFSVSESKFLTHLCPHCISVVDELFESKAMIKALETKVNTIMAKLKFVFNIRSNQNEEIHSCSASEQIENTENPDLQADYDCEDIKPEIIVEFEDHFSEDFNNWELEPTNPGRKEDNESQSESKLVDYKGQLVCASEFNEDNLSDADKDSDFRPSSSENEEDDSSSEGDVGPGNESYEQDKKSERKLECDQCQKTFLNSAGLISHKKHVHTSNRLPKKRLRKRGGPTKQPNVECPHCQKMLPKPYLLQHIARVHTQLRPFSCPTCGMTFKEKRYYNRHMDKYHTAAGEEKRAKRNKRCKFCDKTFVFNQTLDRHIRRDHEANKLRHCPAENCTASFSTEARYDEHLEYFHPKNPEEKLICQICGEHFKNVAEKITHFKKKHPVQKWHKCNQCEKQFKLGKQLKIHERVHTKEAVFLCTSCGKSFSQSTSFMFHRKIVCNPDKNEAELWRKKRADKQREHRENLKKAGKICAVCGKKFATKKNYDEHLKKSHGQKVDTNINSMEIEEDD